MLLKVSFQNHDDTRFPDLLDTRVCWYTVQCNYEETGNIMWSINFTSMSYNIMEHCSFYHHKVEIRPLLDIGKDITLLESRCCPLGSPGRRSTL